MQSPKTRIRLSIATKQSERPLISSKWSFAIPRSFLIRKFSMWTSWKLRWRKRTSEWTVWKLIFLIPNKTWKREQRYMNSSTKSSKERTRSWSAPKTSWTLWILRTQTYRLSSGRPALRRPDLMKSPESNGRSFNNLKPKLKKIRSTSTSLKMTWEDIKTLWPTCQDR